MKIDQYIVALKARRRGFHLITDEVLRQLPGLAAAASDSGKPRSAKASGTIGCELRPHFAPGGIGYRIEGDQEQEEGWLLKYYEYNSYTIYCEIQVRST